MSIPRLLLLKQLLSNSTNHSLKSPQLLISPNSKHFLNLPLFTLRTFSNNNAPHSEIISSVAKSPNSSVIPLLDRYYGGNSDFKPNEDIRNVIRKLRRKKCFDRALEVSEWMASKTLGNPKSGDLACQLSLIGQVHGVDAAENFFSEVDVHCEKMHGALLNCYVEAKLVDKGLSHFKKMKTMGLIMSPLSYHNVMTLYINTGQYEKVPELLSEMEENGVSPDNLTYRICFKSFALQSDISSIENLLKKVECQRGLVINWLTYVVAANYFIEGGLKEKAIYCLQQAEQKIRSDITGFSCLITAYTKVGDLNQVLSLWRKHQRTSKAYINANYKILISSLVKLDQLQEAENFLQEWESCCSFYDFRIVNVLLLGYTKKGMVEKAEKLLEGIINRKLTPIPSTWSIISAGHISCHNMNKALLCFKKALEVGSGPHDDRWIPNNEVVSSLLKLLGEDGQIEEVDEFLKLLSKVVPMNEEMYQTLLKVNIRYGNQIDDILQRMKDENIEVNEETMKIIASRTAS